LSTAARQLDREKSRQASGDITASEVHQAEQVYQQELMDALEARGGALNSYIRLQKSLGGQA
jgi:outer membrane protein TolC